MPAARRSERRPAMGPPAHPPGRPDLPGQPGAAPEAADLIAKIRDNDHYVPEVADPVSPITFVDKINVPVFMACQWTDEQTGGHCPTLAKHMTGTDKSGSPSRTAHMWTRSIRRPTTAFTTS